MFLPFVILLTFRTLKCPVHPPFIQFRSTIKVMGKKKRDSSAPKPPLNSYMEFAREERPRVLLDLGNLSTIEIGKEIGVRWKKLSDDEKQKFVKKFKVNQEKYKADKLLYESSCDEAGMESPAAPSPKQKKKRNPLAPKLPLSSYMEFARSERPTVLKDLGNLSLVEVGKELGRRWKSLSEQEKGGFASISKENKARYDIEMAAFNEKALSEQSGSSVPYEFTHPQQSSSSLSAVVSAPSIDESPTSSTDSSSSSTNSPSMSSSDVSSPSPTDQSATGTTPPQEDIIKLENIGFAKQNKYSWHPAMKTGVFAGGTRVKVTFFGTGHTGTVNKSKWTVYSVQAESRFSTPQLKRSSAYRVGLEQMKSLREKILSDKDAPVTSSGIGFTPQMGCRRFRSLNKDHLQVEEEENIRLMAKKMVQEEGSQYWKCRDCPWRKKFSHKAKSHARDCDQMKKTTKKKMKEKKFDCSHGDCVLSFALRRQLLHHYRYFVGSLYLYTGQP